MSATESARTSEIDAIPVAIAHQGHGPREGHSREDLVGHGAISGVY